jgi:hypothetical protein
LRLTPSAEQKKQEEFGRLGQRRDEGQRQKQECGRARLLYADAVIEGMMCSGSMVSGIGLKFLYQCAVGNSGQIGTAAALDAVKASLAKTFKA